MKKTLFLTLVLLLFCTFALPLFAAAPTVKVVDNAGWLTPEEETQLAKTLSGKTGDVIYCVATVTSRSKPADAAMFDLCDCSSEDAVIALCVYHDGSEYRYYLYTFGPADKAISNNAVDRILDASDVYNNIKAGRIADGCRAFLTAADNEWQTAAAKAERKQATRVPRAIGIGLAVGLVVGGGAALTVFLLYRRKQHGEIYPLDRYAKLNLTLCQDRFIGSYVTRVRVNNSSSSSRSGGGGGGFSGGGRGGR